MIPLTVCLYICIYIYIYIYIYVCVCIYIYMQGAYDRFPDFFLMGI